VVDSSIDGKERILLVLAQPAPPGQHFPVRRVDNLAGMPIISQNLLQEYGMIVNEIMTPHPVCVGLDDRLSKIKHIFDERHFHHVLVVDEGLLVGVISDRDLLKAISGNIGSQRVTVNDLASLDKAAHMIVTRKPITLMAGAMLSEALAIFNSNRISCIPIVDANMAPVGILSWRDILQHFDQIVALEAERRNVPINK
jgi:acetoin utilization protein AcuB